MGYSEKGITMKITELIVPTQKTSMNQQNQADFGQWLDDTEQCKQFTNPEKQSTGDEYYWQHQNHLQHSELHFDAKPKMSAQPKQTAANPSEAAINPSTLMNSISGESSYTVFNAVQEPVHYNLCIKEATALMTELNDALEQANTPYAFASSPYSLQATASAQEQNLPINNFNYPIDFKNNHLFIEGEQAELTLNMQHFNKEEKKELMHLIQEHLKNKGLILSRLIINGVKND